MDIGQLAMQVGRRKRSWELQDDMKRRVLEAQLEDVGRKNPGALDAVMAGHPPGPPAPRLRGGSTGGDGRPDVYPGSPLFGGGGGGGAAGGGTEPMQRSLAAMKTNPFFNTPEEQAKLDSITHADEMGRLQVKGAEQALETQTRTARQAEEQRQSDMRVYGTADPTRLAAMKAGEAADRDAGAQRFLSGGYGGSVPAAPGTPSAAHVKQITALSKEAEHYDLAAKLATEAGEGGKAAIYAAEAMKRRNALGAIHADGSAGTGAPSVEASPDGHIFDIPGGGRVATNLSPDAYMASVAQKFGNSPEQLTEFAAGEKAHVPISTPQPAPAALDVVPSHAQPFGAAPLVPPASIVSSVKSAVDADIAAVKGVAKPAASASEGSAGAAPSTTAASAGGDEGKAAPAKKGKSKGGGKK